MIDQLQSSVLQIKRVSKTTQGKKRVRFTALVAVGDKQGRVGLALGKAPSVATAIQKAVIKAKKDMIEVPITKWHSIPHRVEVKQDAVFVLIKPAPKGAGIKAGSVVRSILELAGYQNVVAKILGSSNKNASAHAALKALSQLQDIKYKRL
ncbi:MAG: 30S ribosomal protein S5 [bacterium]|nr:30S ribosomal protein S5 [bacterium]